MTPVDLPHSVSVGLWSIEDELPLERSGDDRGPQSVHDTDRVLCICEIDRDLDLLLARRGSVRADAIPWAVEHPAEAAHELLDFFGRAG